VADGSVTTSGWWTSARPRRRTRHFRPALIIGPPETFGPGFPFLVVVPLTHQTRAIAPRRGGSSAATGLDEISYAQCELIRSINRNRLVHRLGASIRDEPRVAAVVRTLLGY